MSQRYLAPGVPEWEASVHGPVLPDPLILPDPRTKERHGRQPQQWEVLPAHTHHRGAQLPGTPNAAVLLIILIKCNIWESGNALIHPTDMIYWFKIQYTVVRISLCTHAKVD